MPGVLEGFDLRVRHLAGWLFEQDVVVGHDIVVAEERAHRPQQFGGLGISR
jgi:hypothetical protein